MFATLIKAIGLLRRSPQGASLVETAIATGFAGIAAAATVGMAAVGVAGGGLSADRTAAEQVARSQMELVLGETYQSDGIYPEVRVPEGLGLEIDVQELRPGLLQRIEVNVSGAGEGTGGSPLASVATLKANRLLTTGEQPPSGGLEAVNPVSVPDLAPGTGFYYTITVMESESTGSVVGRWTVLAGDTDLPRITVAVLEGTPFGQGSGVSLAAPDAVSATRLASGSSSDLVTETLAVDPSPGRYTVYFYNDVSSPRTVITGTATIACICER